MKDLAKNKDVLIEIIDEITAEADELLNDTHDEDSPDYINGQLLAYATALGIIKSCLSGYELKEYGLDYDIDKKYLL